MRKTSFDYCILRVYVSSTDKLKDRLLHEYLVFKAKEFGLAGATVTKGILAYGASSVIHSIKFWEVSEKVPTVVEMVDREDKLLSFYDEIGPELEAMRYGCLVTMTPTAILLQKSGRKFY